MAQHSNKIVCACGCGFPITPGMYAYAVGDAYYARGCVDTVLVSAQGCAPSGNVTVIGSETKRIAPMTPVPDTRTA